MQKKPRLLYKIITINNIKLFKHFFETSDYQSKMSLVQKYIFLQIVKRFKFEGRPLLISNSYIPFHNSSHICF